MRFLTSVVRDHKALFACAALLSLAVTAASLCQPLLMQRLVQGAAAPSRPTGPALLLACLVIVAAVATGMRDLVLQTVGARAVAGLRTRLTDHVLRLPFATLDAHPSGDLLSRVSADTASLQGAISAGVVNLMAGMLLMGGALIAMALVDPVLCAITLAGLGAALAVALAGTRALRERSTRLQEALGQLTQAVHRALTGLRTLRAARATPREVATVAQRTDAVYRRTLALARLQCALAPLAETLVQATFLAVLAAGGVRIAQGSLEFAQLLSFVMYLFYLLAPLGQTLSAWSAIQQGLGAWQRIDDVLALPTETAGDDVRALRTETAGDDVSATPTETAVDDGRALPIASAHDAPTRTVASHGGPALGYRHVTFTRPGGRRTLDDVTLDVARTGMTALVGPSGAGKSTLLDLTERFYDADAGTILLHGRDITTLDRDELRARLGYVQQDALALGGTLRDNLRVQAPRATEAQLRAALSTVGLDDLVRHGGQGLDTVVGEGGSALSGGERQRLALARVLLATPDVLLLDEPSSHLDAVSEAATRRVILHQANRRAVLVVAHRLSTVTDADTIAVMDEGRISATGNHQQLLERSPLYRRLAREQLLA
ncbi:ABC transporter ATP-binding protein [Streptomyces sp. NPDC004111]|uniref:ABC transporter ATP-binding protein n=1 Tax=Streptomyces sp. NPDC004111 TaxID=3364690 RepID=UPI00369DE2F1